MLTFICTFRAVQERKNSKLDDQLLSVSSIFIELNIVWNAVMRLYPESGII
jgi:hypothetical protein